MNLLDLAFTPSELVLLRGEKFTPRARTNEGIKLLHADYDVSGPLLSQTMLLAAVLANEQMGYIKLANQDKKGNFIGVGDIVLTTLGSSYEWTQFSLESAIIEKAIARQAARERCDVRSVVFEIIGRESRVPWALIIDLVENGLVASDWLMPVKGDALKAFSTPFVCPAKVQELVNQQPIEVIGKMLLDCKNNRPMIWKSLNDQIALAFQDRTFK